MEYELRRSSKLTIMSDYFLNTLRRRLTKYHIISLVRILRPLIHFGPWRILPRLLIRQFRPALQTTDKDQTSLLGFLDENAIAEEVRRESVAIPCVLPLEFVSRMRAVTDRLPIDDYQLMHHIDENVRRLSDDPAIKNVLRAYFKCEPVLLESTLVITGPHHAHGPSEQNTFHFDYAGWDSLNVFVYLNDVTADSSHHIVVKGSHRHIGFRDVLRGSLTEDEALARFGSAIQAITGPAGTVFFENTEAFHRRYPGNQRRVMLNLLFASHRSWLSRGRTGRDHIQRRAQAYDRFRALS